MKTFLLVSIWFYRYFISPFMISSCRFYPTCSAYALGAVGKYGVIVGVFLIIKRISRCNSWFKGGHDPVP